MAAATENSARYTDYWGRTPVEIVNVTWANNDTFATQFAAVKAVHFEPTTNASHGTTKSGKTVTLVSSGSLTGDLIVFGDGE